MLKKLAGLPIRYDLGPEPTTFTHKINAFRIEKVINTWAEVSSPCQKSHSCYISISLDFYLMIDLISISFIKFFDLIPCTKLKHQHIVPTLKDIDEINPQIYNFYHLRLFIINCFNYIFNFTCSFLAIN